MRALVTGGAGFIGSNLALALLERGDSVVILDDLSSGWATNLPASTRAQFIRADVCDSRYVRDAMEGVSCVFHLAASVGNKRSIDHPVRDAEINVLGTLQVLEAARAAGVRKIVVSSSAAVFGELKTLPIREDHPVEPDSPYGASKLGAEKETLAFGKLHSIETVCLRYFNVYGPRQRFDAYGNVIPIFVFQALREEPLTIFGDGKQTRDFVHVGDVVQANLKAADTPGVRGAFNIGSGTRISINGLVDRLRTTMDGLLPVRYAPARPGDVRDSLADITAARTAFGFEPRIGLTTGLADYVAWARREDFALAR
ncbi:MAG: NAD-dependent epimerase/dehydratase family protein [Acidobacteriaceae bacterium]